MRLEAYLLSLKPGGKLDMNPTTAPHEHRFDSFGIDPKILATLTQQGISTPTPIQYKAIPDALQGKDVIGIAQTGTGKTLAFGIPMLQQLAKSEMKGLILLPTRELALQVDETLAKLGGPMNIRTAVLIGGANMRQQVGALRRNPNIVIATPGRLIDHLQQGTIRLDKVAILVLDEADRMLDMGFKPQIRKILETVPKERQTMLFSATLSRDIAQIALKHMKSPISIEVAPQGTTAEKVSQEFFIVHRDQKDALLESVLQKYTGSTLVFARTKHGAKKVMMAVQTMGHKAAEIHGNRSLSQRREALDGFKSGKYRVLVATDIASRGIDVKGIELVVNFDLPMDSSDYVHRIGRTARAGAEGHAISLRCHQSAEVCATSSDSSAKPFPSLRFLIACRGHDHRPTFRPRTVRMPDRAAAARADRLARAQAVQESFQVRTGGRGPRRPTFHATPRHKRRQGSFR